jgi:phage gpG-like protein
MKVYSDVLEKFDNMLDLTKNFKPVFRTILGTEGPDSPPWTLKGGVHYSIAKGTTPGRTRVAPLSPKYKAWKAKHFSGDLPIRMLTGRMYDSLVNKGEGAVEAISNTKLVYGTSVVYAAAHQYGNPSKKLPARPFLGFAKGQMARINLELRKYLLDAYNRKQRIEVIHEMQKRGPK